MHGNFVQNWHKKPRSVVWTTKGVLSEWILCQLAVSAFCDGASRTFLHGAPHNAHRRIFHARERNSVDLPSSFSPISGTLVVEPLAHFFSIIEHDMTFVKQYKTHQERAKGLLYIGVETHVGNILVIRSGMSWQTRGISSDKSRQVWMSGTRAEACAQEHW